MSVSVPVSACVCVRARVCVCMCVCVCGVCVCLCRSKRRQSHFQQPLRTWWATSRLNQGRLRDSFGRIRWNIWWSPRTYNDDFHSVPHIPPRNVPIRARTYQCTEGRKKVTNKEVSQLLAKDIIRRSTSEYNSPIVIIQNIDGTQVLLGLATFQREDRRGDESTPIYRGQTYGIRWWPGIFYAGPECRLLVAVAE